MTVRDRMKFASSVLLGALIFLLWFALFFFVMDIIIWMSIIMSIGFSTATILYGLVIVFLKNGLL